MLIPLFAGAVFQLAAASQPVLHAREGQVTAPAVRVDTTIEVDGRLTEPVWQRAALLTGFSLYAPADDRPAPDSTEVLVWYSADAMYVGVRAFEPHGEVRATLAERDRISGDDNVEIHFDTFDERRRALVFIVNPLGIQADGTKSEGGGFIPGSNVSPGQTDLSADFRWQSRGQVTAWGYEVELRIPFSSMRYPVGMPQQWGIQVVRKVQHSGYEQTWTPARRASNQTMRRSTLVGTLAPAKPLSSTPSVDVLSMLVSVGSVVVVPAVNLLPVGSATSVSCCACVSFKRRPSRVRPCSRASTRSLRAMSRSGVCRALSSLLYERLPISSRASRPG